MGENEELFDESCIRVYLENVGGRLFTARYAVDRGKPGSKNMGFRKLRRYLGLLASKYENEIAGVKYSAG